MIKITISDTQKMKMENTYWKWFARYHLDGMIQIIEQDDVIRKIIQNEDKDVTNAIKKFLLMDYKRLEEVKIWLDCMDRTKSAIRAEMSNFLYERYKNFRDTQAAKIVSILGMSVCPYCNQNHLNIVHDKNGKLKFRGDLDHFYDKSTYPELMICLYNLIPVCHVCNQLKSFKKEIFANPYNCDKKSKIKFITDFDGKVDLNYLQGKSQNFRITIERFGLSSEDVAEIELFDLEKRYQQLKRNVQEIIIKSKAYDEIYMQQLQEKFNLSGEEINQYIFGYTDNHLDRVLSKFNQDIRNEFSDKD